ncbi:MAG: lipid-A-disaccharide synthase N-terminal domain-containing protein [Pseudomonadota bacterium]
MAEAETHWVLSLLLVESWPQALLALYGLTAQALFMSRMMLQWIASEREGRSVVPVAFWWLSLSGAAMLLVYGVLRQDIVIILAQAFGLVVYVRNLILIAREKRAAAAEPG